MSAGSMAQRKESSRLRRVWRWAEDASDVQLFVALYGIALAVRVAAALLIGIHTLPVEGDQLNYFRFAISLVNRHEYMHFWRDGVLRATAGKTPGTSMFVALGLLLFGMHHESARL